MSTIDQGIKSARASTVPSLQSPARATTGASPYAIRLVLCLIAVAIGVTYANSLNGGFVFDDLGSIPANPTIRHLWPISRALTPPSGTGVTVEGRPILNLSFAVNYALGGTAVQGYHVANLAIHILACLLLFGIVRRTLEKCGEVLRKDAVPIACVCALIWGLHPLQTESVTYIVQRAESLMGLFFLMSLYSAIRADRSAGWGWPALCVISACLCAGTKEVAVALPVIVLLYDRTFLAGSFAEAWRKHRPVYLGLAASWLILASLVLATGNRGGTIGAQAGITPWGYALCQSRAIFRYLGLCFWPAPLIVDYGSDFVTFTQALPWAILLLAILSAVVWALVKRPALGFLGAWFFVILAPTSSFVGGTRQMLADHRLYLPLAAIVVGTILLIHRAWGRKALLVGGVVAAALSVVTAARNKVYHDGLTLCEDTVLHRPNNAWAHNALGLVLTNRPGRQADAIAQYEAALRLKPDYAAPHYNLGLVLAKQPGRQTEAIAQYEAALRLKPDSADAHDNLGVLLANRPGRQAEATEEFEAALRFKPDDADAHNNLGLALASQPGRQAEATAQFEAALRFKPDFAEAHYNLANLLAHQPGRQIEAIAEYEAALRLNPDYAEAHNNLANVLASQPGREAEAWAHYETALELKPDYALAHYNLANLLARRSGQRANAIAQYETALSLEPDNAEAHNRLAILLAGQPGRADEAIANFEDALRLRPRSFFVHYNLGRLFARLNRPKEAALQFSAALKINPGFTPARDALQRLARAGPRRPVR
ncbi:MAG: tetratricopeptide repeat protein [Opitutaceae bacterium]